MLLTGFDSPPLHTIYIDKPMRGAALMQALARVNRTFRNKQDGLLVGYAPLTENLYEALAEYTARDQTTKPMGRDIDDAVAKVQDMLAVIGDEILSGYDWRAQRAVKGPKAHLNAVLGAVNYLRDPATPGNQVEEGEADRRPAVPPGVRAARPHVRALLKQRRPRRLPVRHRVLRGDPRLYGPLRRRGPQGPR